MARQMGAIIDRYGLDDGSKLISTNLRELAERQKHNDTAGRVLNVLGKVQDVGITLIGTPPDTCYRKT